jgi:hypothetical protein
MSNKKSLTITRQPTKFVTVTEKEIVSTVTEPADQTIEIHDPGVAGPPNTLTVGTVTTGDAAVSITGIAPNQVINFVLPTRVRHTHTQATPSNTWTINHALGGYPSVSVVDSARTVVFGEVTYQSTTQVVVNFSTAFSGYAYLT